MSIRISLLYLCLLCGCFSALSQPMMDEFEKRAAQIAARRDDTTKVMMYIRIIDSVSNKTSAANAMIIAKRVKLLADQLNYNYGRIESYLSLGIVYEQMERDYPKAIECYKSAIKLCESSRNYRDIDKAYSCVLNMYYYTGDYPSAMAIAQKGLVLAELRNDKAKLAHYNNQLGFIYVKQENPAESIKYYSKYLDLATQLGKPMMIADADNSMADVALMQRNYKETLGYLFKALAIYKNFDGAANFGKSPVKINSDRVPYTLYKISNTYKLQEHYQLALQYALLGLKYTNGHHLFGFNQYDLASFYINAGEVYSAVKDYDHAMRFLDSGLTISKTIRHREDIRDAYKGLAKTFALQKIYDSAYHYQQLYAVLKDSIINEKASRAVEQIRNSFENYKKDKEIALLHQSQKLKEAESEKKSLLLNIVVVCFTLLAVISYLIFYIRNNHKQQKLALEKQVAVQNERQRISGDMHDDIGTGLSTMLIYVNMLKEKLNGTDGYPDVERVASLGNELVAQMKEIVWSLNPVNDSLENLLIFIRQYFSHLFEYLPYRTNLIFPAGIPEIAIKGSVRRNIYLCVKEALNNVIKHAHADWVELSIVLTAHELIIHVKDDGSGFPDNSGNKFFSNGLRNMQHRMEQIGGDFSFCNSNGALISIKLNLHEVAKQVVV